VQENAHDLILGLSDYELWLEWDYQVYCIKNPIKQFWTTRDENVNVTDYLFNIDFILNGAEVKDTKGQQSIKAEFKTYEDFNEDSRMSTREKKAAKVSVSLTPKEG
jgi:hypothetical protein